MVPGTVLISEACLLRSVLAGLVQNYAVECCSHLSAWRIEFQGLGMLPGADLWNYFLLAGCIQSVFAAQWGKSLFCTQVTPLWFILLFHRWSVDELNSEAVQRKQKQSGRVLSIAVSSMARANFFEQWQQTSFVYQLSLEASFTWMLASGMHASDLAFFPVP